MVERHVAGPSARVRSPAGGSAPRWVVLCAVLGVVCVLFSISLVRLRVQKIRAGYRMAKLQEEYEQLISVQRKLRLEWDRLQDPYELERMGREHFGLGPARSDQKVSVR